MQALNLKPGNEYPALIRSTLGKFTLQGNLSITARGGYVLTVPASGMVEFSAADVETVTTCPQNSTLIIKIK